MPAVAPTPSVAPPAPLADAEARPSRWVWTREQYDRMVDTGILTTEHDVELLGGQVVKKMSQNEPHAVSTGLVSDVLRDVFGAGAHTRDEKPLALSDLSEPEPDIVVARGARRDYLNGHPAPASVLLLVEVADTSLLQDRRHKLPLYAEAGIVECWIVNLRDRQLEVYRDPAGEAYRTKTTHRPDEAVAPVARPDARVSVADLLP